MRKATRGLQDAVIGTVDRLIELGYLLRAEGGLGKGPTGLSKKAEPLTENDRLATMDVLSDVVGRL